MRPVIVAESRMSRRLVGRLEKGIDLLEGLASVCRAHHVRSGELRAHGALENAALCEYDQRARVFRSARRFESQLEILHLSGMVSERASKPHLEARATLSRERDNGIELVGGRITAGRVFAVEYVIDVFDDLRLNRAMDANTGLDLYSELIAFEVEAPVVAHVPFEAPARTTVTSAQTPPPHVVAPAPSAPSGPAWSEVAAASAASVVSPPASAAPESEVVIGPGDFIEHPKFGRCQVERIEGDHEFVSARLRNQRLIRLSLDVLQLIPIGKEGAHQLFRALPGK
jgi:predicted DNA-binding protein with PD1-like motif